MILLINNSGAGGATGHEAVFLKQIHFSTQLILFMVYYERDQNAVMTLPRNAQIQTLYANGNSLADIAREYGLSTQRIYQIVHQKPKPKHS